MRALALAMVIAAATAGCETFGSRTCDRSAEGNPVIDYTGGTAEDGVYMSSPWGGELIYFPGGMHLQLEHGLGATPKWVNEYLSFDRYGTTDGGSLAQAAGNQVLVTDMNNQAIVLVNDSCVDYWILVTAGTGAQVSPGP